MENQWLLSPARQLTEEEKFLVWQKPDTHIESDAERRICSEVKRTSPIYGNFLHGWFKSLLNTYSNDKLLIYWR